MEEDSEILLKSLENIREEKDTAKWPKMFGTLANTVKARNVREDVRATIFQTFCLMCEKLEEKPDLIKEILSILALYIQSDTGLIIQFVHPLPEKIKDFDSLKKEEKISIKDFVNDNAFHTLAKQKKGQILEVILKSLSDLGLNCNMDTTDSQGNTVCHCLIAGGDWVGALKIILNFSKKFSIDYNLKNVAGQSVQNMMCAEIINSLQQTVKENDLKTAEQIIQLIGEASEIIPLGKIFWYPELNISFFHYIIHFATDEYFELMLSYCNKHWADISLFLNKKEELSGTNFLSFSLGNCRMPRILRVFELFKESDLTNQEKNGNTLLHSIVANRKLSLSDKIELAQKLIMLSPGLCNIENKEGHKPLTYYMLALHSAKDQDLVSKCLDIIAEKTEMTQWRDPKCIAEINCVRLTSLFELQEYSCPRKSEYVKQQIKQFNNLSTDIKRKEINKFNAERKKRLKQNTVWSPIEAAVFCRREDWLALFLDKYKLSGNLIMNEGRHILSFALENCSQSLIELLLHNGGLERTISNKHFIFDLDGVFAGAWLKTNSRLYSKIDSIPKIMSPTLQHYSEFIKKAALNIKNSAVLDLSNFVIKPSHYEKSELNEMEEINKLKMIECLAKKYMNSIRTKLDIYSPQNWNQQIESNVNILPIKNAIQFAIHLSGIPSASSFCLTIIKELYENLIQREECVIKILRLALQRGNLPLIQSLDINFQEASQYLDSLIGWAEAPSLKQISNAEIANRIIGMLEYYCDNPETFLNYLASRCPKSILNQVSLRSYKKPQFANWKNLGNVYRNRLEINDVLYKLMLKDWPNKLDTLSGIENSPLFLWRLIEIPIPSLKSVALDVLERMDSFIFQLFDGIMLSSRKGHFAVSITLVNFIYKLCCEFLNVKFNQFGSKYSFDSPDFVFMLINFRKFMKKSFLLNPEINSVLETLLSQSDIKSLKFYTTFISSLNRQFSFHRHPLKFFPILCQEKHILLPELLQDKFGFNIPSGKKSTLSKFFESKEAFENISENKLIFPYLIYSCFCLNKTKKGISSFHPILSSLLENKNYEMMKLIYKKCVIIKPSIFYKVASSSKSDLKSSESFINSLLDHLSTVTASKMKALYELRYFVSLLKSPEKLCNIRKSLHIDDCVPLVYGLIDTKYGYAMNNIARFCSQDLVQKLQSKYNLPLNIVSIELSNPKAKNLIEDGYFSCIRKDLSRKDWIMIRKEQNPKEEKRVISRVVYQNKKRTIRAYIPKKMPKQYPAYRITTPILELVNANLQHLSKAFNVESILLSMNPEHMQTILIELLYYLSWTGKITGSLFKRIISVGTSSVSISQLCSMYQKPILAFIYSQGIDSVFLLLLKEVPKGKAYVEKLLNIFLTISILKYDTKGLLELFAIKQIFNVGEGKVYIPGIISDYKQQQMFALYNQPLQNAVLLLFENEEVKLIFNTMFRLDYVAASDLIEANWPRQNYELQKTVMVLLALIDPQLWSSYIEYALKVEKHTQLGYFRQHSVKQTLYALAEELRLPSKPGVQTKSLLFRINSCSFDKLVRGELKAGPSTQHLKKERYYANQHRAPMGSDQWKKEISLLRSRPPQSLSQEDIKKLLESKTLSKSEEDKYKEILSTVFSQFAKPTMLMIPRGAMKRVSVDIRRKIKPLVVPMLEKLKLENCTNGEEYNLLVKALILHNSPDLSPIIKFIIENIQINGYKFFEDIISEYEKIGKDSEIHTFDLLDHIFTVAEVTSSEEFNFFMNASPFGKTSKNEKFIHKLMEVVSKIVIKAEENENWNRTLLAYAIQNNFPEIVKMHVEQYSKNYEIKIQNTILLNRLEMGFNNPILLAIYRANTSPEILQILLHSLPKPYFFGPNAKKKIEAGLDKLESLTPLEVAIFYDKQKHLEEILIIKEYEEYAIKNAIRLAEICCKWGGLSSCKRMLSLVGAHLEPKHLLLAIGSCNNESCIEILENIQNRYSPQDIISISDDKKCNLLHKIAQYGKKNILLKLRDLNIFNYADPGPLLPYLKERNDININPHCTALQSENLDIASALFVVPDTLESISDEEFNIMTSPKLPLLALTQYKDDVIFKREGALWAELIPERDKIIILFERLSKMKHYEFSPESGSMRQNGKSGKNEPKCDDTIISLAANMIKNGRIDVLLTLLLFRKDVFYCTRLLHFSFKIKEALYSSLIANKSCYFALSLLVRFGFIPEVGEELEAILLRSKIKSDQIYLFLLEELQVFPRYFQSKASSLLFSRPYEFFYGQHNIILGGISFEMSEFDCLFPSILRKPKIAINYSSFNIIEFAKNCVEFLQVRTFSAVLFACREDEALFNKIKLALDKHSLFYLFFHSFPLELPWALNVLKSCFKMSYNYENRIFYLDGGLTDVIDLNGGENVASALLYYALHFAGELLVCEQPFPEENIVKATLEKAIYGVLKLYWNHRVIFQKAEEGEEHKTSPIFYHDIQRILIIWENTYKKILSLEYSFSDISKIFSITTESPRKIDEQKFALRLIEILNPNEIILKTGNGSISFYIDNESLLSYASAVSKTLNQDLITIINSLFSFQYIFGIQEIRDSNSKFDMKVSVICDSSSHPASVKIYSFNKDFFLKNNCYEVCINLTLNSDPSDFSKIPEMMPELNDQIYSQISISILKLQPPIKFELKHLSQNFILSMGSVKEHFDLLNSLFSPSIALNLFSILESEIRMLGSYVNDCEKECRALRAPFSLDYPQLSIPENFKVVLKAGQFEIVPPENYSIKLSSSYTNNSEQYLLDSLSYWKSPFHFELNFVIPNDRTMQSPCLEYESYLLYPILRVFASESQFIKRLSAMLNRKLPFIRLDTITLLKSVIIPVFSLMSKRPDFLCPWNSSLNLLQEYLELTDYLSLLIKKVLIHIVDLNQKFERQIDYILVTFDARKGQPLEAYQNKFDSLIALNGCEIKRFDSLVTISVGYDMDLILKRASLISAIDCEESKTAAQQEAYTKHFDIETNSIKVMESVMNLVEILEKYIGRNEKNNNSLSMALEKLFGKKIKAEIDYRSLYDLIQSHMNPKLAGTGTLTERDSYYSYQAIFYNTLSEIGRQLDPHKLYQEIALAVGNQINEIFLGFLQSKMDPENENTGVLSFQKNSPSSDWLFRKSNCKAVESNTCLNYEIFEEFTMSEIQYSTKLLRGKMGLFPNSLGTYIYAEFICLKCDKISCKVKGKATLFKFNENLTYYFEYDEKFDLILGTRKKLFIADTVTNIHEITLEGFEAIQRSKKSGTFISNLLPDILTLTFIPHSEVPVSKFEKQELKINCLVDMKKGTVKWVKPKLTHNIPFKFHLYNSADYCTRVEEFYSSIEKVLEELMILPKAVLPLIKIDFSAFSNKYINERYYSIVTNSIYTALIAITEAILSISRASYAVSNSEINPSLTYNFNKRGEIVEKVNIGRKLINYLISNQIILRLSVNQVFESVLIQDEGVINLLVPLRLEDSGGIQSLLQDNFKLIVYNLLVSLLIKSESMRLEDAIEKQAGTLPAFDIEDPLGISYSDAIFYVKKQIHPAKLKIRISESCESIDRLRMIFALPKFFEHLGHAFRHVKKMPILNLVKISIVNGDLTQSQSYILTIKEFVLCIELRNLHNSQLLIPSENELIKSILREILKPESDVSPTLFCSIIDDKGLPKILPPYTELPELRYNFGIFEAETLKFIFDSALCTSIEVSCISLCDLDVAVSSVNIIDKGLHINIKFPHKGYYKLIMFLGQHIVFSTVLMCKVLPSWISAVDTGRISVFSPVKTGSCKKGKDISLRNEIDSKLSIISSFLNREITNFIAFPLTETLLYFNITCKKESMSSSNLFYNLDEEGRLLPISRPFSEKQSCYRNESFQYVNE